jgi:hypothetical protein
MITEDAQTNFEDEEDVIIISIKEEVANQS